MNKFSLILYVFLAVMFLSVDGCEEETVLDRYIAKPDPNYAYEHYNTHTALGCTTYMLKLTSQEWRTPGEVNRTIWEHELMICVPLTAYLPSHTTAILLVDGGSNPVTYPTEPPDELIAAALATGSVVTFVRQVPNQPLFFTDEGGKRRSEDALIAYSLDKFLVTQDEEWPVHLPMTKSVVRAMDTVQRFLGSKRFIRDFIVLGGSKRGWITYLTAAVDKRVKAIIPASIDIFNIDAQLDHHWDAYGFYSSAIKDYEDFDIFCRAKSPEGQALLDIVDPFSYIERYTMHKLILNSAGDQFFLPDSSRFYYDQLPEPKQMRYSVNTDHYQASVWVLLSALSWGHDILDGVPQPKFSWVNQPDGSILVTTFKRPKEVKLWQATNPVSRDFRLETIGEAWTSTPLMDHGNGTYSGYCPPPPSGWTAFLIELTYDEMNFWESDQVFTTDVRVTPDVLPFKGTHCAD